MWFDILALSESEKSYNTWKLDIIIVGKYSNNIMCKDDLTLIT